MTPQHTPTFQFVHEICVLDRHIELYDVHKWCFNNMFSPIFKCVFLK